MIESKDFSEDLKTAELQFDSLLNTGATIDKRFIKQGIEVKAKLGKDTTKIAQQFARLLKDDEAEELIENKALQMELIKLFIQDQAVRGNLQKDLVEKYKIDINQLILEDISYADEYNRDQLKEMIKAYGFPTKKLVGKDALQGAFFIIQHADGDRNWQASQLKNIEKTVQNGDLGAQKYALLYDRIKVGKKEKQLYGTQFKLVDRANNTYDLQPVEDIKNLNKRRMEMDMMPIEMYKRIHNKYVQDSMEKQDN